MRQRSAARDDNFDHVRADHGDPGTGAVGARIDSRLHPWFSARIDPRDHRALEPTDERHDHEDDQDHDENVDQRIVHVPNIGAGVGCKSAGVACSKPDEDGDLVVVEAEFADEPGEGAQAGVDSGGLDLAGHRITETGLRRQRSGGQAPLVAHPAEDVADRGLRTQRGDPGG